MGRRGNKWNHIKSITVTIGDCVVIIPLNDNEKISDRISANRDLQMMGKAIKNDRNILNQQTIPIEQLENAPVTEDPDVNFDLFAQDMTPAEFVPWDDDFYFGMDL